MQAQVKEWGNSQGIRLSKEILKSAGIDLSNKKTIQVSIDKFNSLLQELEKLTNN